MMGGELGVQPDVLQVTFDVGGRQRPEHARRGLGHFHIYFFAGLVPACAERSRETRVRQTRSWLVSWSILRRFEAFRGHATRSRGAETL